MGLPLVSLLMAMVVSQASASEEEEAQENQENPMDGRTTTADFIMRDDEEAPLERLAKSRPVQRGTRVSAAAKNFGKTGGQWAVATFGRASF